MRKSWAPLSDKDKRFLAKVWKDGKFKTYNFIGVRDIIERLERLGIIERIDFFNYSVKREKYNEILNEEPRETKQQKLF